MNKLKMILFSTIFILLMFAPIIQVGAIQQSEFNPITNWSEGTFYQGDSGTVRIHLYSTCGDEIEFKTVGIHFAWMSSNLYYSNDVSTKIPSNGDTEFSPISYQIDANAPVGSNTVKIRFDFKEHHWYGWTDEHWEGSYTISVHSSYEKAYYDLKSRVGYTISERIANSNYEGPQAKASISQASNEYSMANSFANQGSWQEALSHLTTASNLVDQASAQEQEYKNQQQQNQQLQTQQQQQQLQQTQTLQQQWIVIGLILIVVVIALILTVAKLKKKNK